MDIDEREIERMMRLTGGSRDQCHFFLEACGGNFERAVDMLQEQGVHRLPNDAHRQIAVRGDRPVAGNQPLPLQLVNAALTAPLTVVSLALRLAVRSVAFGATVIGAASRRFLPPPVFQSLRAIFSGRRGLTPAEEADNFVSEFEQRYGSRRPAWQRCSWQDATAVAHADSKLLFVYLHARRHQDADRFCRNTLCDPAFVDYVNSTFISWGGTLRSTDAMRLARSIHASGYPYCGLLALSGTRTRLLFASEGPLSPTELSTGLQAALVEHGSLLQHEASERARRERDRRLREEQDLELQRSLAADQEKERQQKEAAEAAANEQRRLLEEARQAEIAAADEQKRQEEAERMLAVRREEKLAGLPSEPPVDVTGVALIRVRLPNGIAQQRRFLATDPLQRVCDWVDSLDSHAHLKYALATTYPRKVLKGPVVLEKSLEELELVPQAALLVQPEDEEDDA